MGARALAVLRAAPVTVPCAVVTAIVVWWASDGGGFAIQQWAPGLIAVLALIAVTALTVPNGWGRLPGPVLLAAVLLQGYVLWSFASVTWAPDAGAAWEGANRTALFAAVFCLFALWPQRPEGATVLLAAWVLGVTAVALVLLYHLGRDATPQDLFNGPRLRGVASYPNAAAALLLMPLGPAILLAGSRRVPPAVRGAAAASAVILASVALLSLSRGSVLATPIMAVALLVVVPGRLRTLAVLVLVAAGTALAATVALDVGDIADTGSPEALRTALDATVLRTLLAAGLVGLVAAGVAVRERTSPPSPETEARIARAGTAVAIGVALLLVVGGLAAAGNPVHRIDSAWTSFKGTYTEAQRGGDRLAGGLGSNRYDFYRVALNMFRERPLAGWGVDNFESEYLTAGRSAETPRFPHSIELKVLSQTGLVGALLLFGAFGAALVAAWRAMRTRDDLARVAAGGGAAAFLYWFVHGSADWFFEWGGLGSAAFLGLGVACGLCPRVPVPVTARAPLSAPRPWPAVVLAAAVFLLAAVAPAGMWLSATDVTKAGELFGTRPFAAYDRLARAADANPFSDRPLSVEGSIALRYDDYTRADRAFTEVLTRTPDDPYATLELGAIASARGQDLRALELLARAVSLSPRDPIAREAFHVVAVDGTLDVAELNRRILAGAQQLVNTGQ